MIYLILGGARSGKSAYAQNLVQKLEQQGFLVQCVATARAIDDEMTARIKHHQANRPKHWHTIEEPLNIHNALQNIDKKAVVIDCLTVWLTNILFEDVDRLQDYKTQLFNALQAAKQQNCHVVLVGNETGLGVVPMGELSRRFVDENGWLHQQLASICDEVVLCVAGIGMTLKSQTGCG